MDYHVPNDRLQRCQAGRDGARTKRARNLTEVQRRGQPRSLQPYPKIFLKPFLKFPN